MENGRGALMCYDLTNKESRDVDPACNVRSRVHEYGGGEYLACLDRVFFVDGNVFEAHSGEIRKLTGDIGKKRFADFTFCDVFQKLICVCEDHEDEENVVNLLVSIDMSTGVVNKLEEGSDFYSFPRLFKASSKTLMCWLSWNHPNMPWDGTELWIGELECESDQPICSINTASRWKVAGGEEESVCLPSWSPCGDLYYCSDRSGWWCIYRATASSNYQTSELICSLPDAEFGLPQWQFGQSTYGFTDDNRLVCCYKRRGKSTLAVVSLDDPTFQLRTIEVPFCSIISVTCSGTKVAFLGTSNVDFPNVIVYDLSSNTWESLRSAASFSVDPNYISPGEFIEFPTEDNKTAFGTYYCPFNKDYRGTEGTKPPLIVKSHGGPTSSMASGLNLSIQYWTSRGFALLDVDYGGSANYGRAFRNRMWGNWGIVDVNDCTNGAKFLAESMQVVDGSKMAITGGSAGGYTTLCALAFKDVFSAGASHYGVGDLETLARDTHKFESRYLDRIVAPYPAGKDVYQARSAVHSVSSITCPVIFFQGLDDKVVLPNQAEAMVEVLNSLHRRYSYITFEGEGHGFRKAQNIIRALDGEFSFYSQIFGFVPADEIEPVKIENS